MRVRHVTCCEASLQAAKGPSGASEFNLSGAACQDLTCTSHVHEQPSKGSLIVS